MIENLDNSKSKKIIIIGGGISGCLSALELSKKDNVEIELYERNHKILSGTPFCHLHSGGMLYPDLKLSECKDLLYHSLLFASYFENCLINRPTIIAYRKNCSYDSKFLKIKCKEMQYYYELWIVKNKQMPLGQSNTYYAEYTKYDMLMFKKNKLYNTNTPYHDKYVRTFCELLNNIDDIQYPFVSVKEFGISMEKIYKEIYNRLENTHNVKIYTNTEIQKITNTNINNKWNVYISSNVYFADYLINAAGYNIGEISLNKNGFYYVELKSSWLIKNENLIEIPEIAIIGERGTSNGMIQLTPMEEKYMYQIHCMTQDSTLFEGGCVKIYNKDKSNIYSYFPKKLKTIIKTNTISNDEIKIRTSNAINNVSHFFPMFNKSKIQNNPLWGIQRIVGKSTNTRTNDYLIQNNYIEIQIIKAISSVYSIQKLSHEIII